MSLQKQRHLLYPAHFLGNFLPNFGCCIYWRVNFTRRRRLLKVFFTIYFVKRSDFKKVLKMAFDKSKSDGHHQRAVDSYASLSKRQMLKCSTTNRKLRKFTVKSTKSSPSHIKKSPRTTLNWFSWYAQYPDCVQRKIILLCSIFNGYILIFLLAGSSWDKNNQMFEKRTCSNLLLSRNTGTFVEWQPRWFQK